jgi:hypothetical protein
VGSFQLFRFWLDQASLRTRGNEVLRLAAVRSYLAPAAERKTNATHQEIRKKRITGLTTSAS